MDFYFARDWLGKEGPYAFRLDHILFIVISLSLGFLLALFLKNKSKSTIKKTLIVLWIVSVITELSYYIPLYVYAIIDPSKHPFSLEGMLPFHSCLMFMYIFPFAIFSKNKVIKTASSNFLVVVNMIMGFITLFVGCPTKGFSALSFSGIQSLIFHAIIVIVPFIMIFTNYYDVKRNDIFYGISLFGILSLLMWIFDACTGCDYFYIYDGHTFGILYEISENVPHIVWTLIVISCYIITAFVIHYLIIIIKYLINKKQSKKDASQ